MLNPDFNRVGIAGYKVNGNIYWVQDFGTRYDPSPVDSINVFSIEGNQSSYPKFKINLPIYATGYFIVKLNGHEVMRKSILFSPMTLRHLINFILAMTALMI
jgi:hypothetical protein